MWKLYEIYISLSINKYNGNAAMLIHWCIVCGHFCVTRMTRRIAAGTIWSAKPKIFISRSYKAKLPTPVLDRKGGIVQVSPSSWTFKVW